MGKDLYDNFSVAREVFEEVNDALSEKLTSIIFDGPEDALKATINTQPALMAVSVAVMRVIEKESGRSLEQLANYVAGHSLGEYSALCSAGSISLSDTARLLRTRGQAMQDAVPLGKGGMVALVGVTFDKAQEISQAVVAEGICEAANDNGGGQVVVSGELSALERVLEIASEYGAKRAVKLPVSAPFHSSLMQKAADVMQQALADAEVQAPKVPVIANVTAAEVTDPQAIRDLLVEQVTGTVRWRESIEYIGGKGITECVEVGAGKVLSGLARRINKELGSQSIQTTEDIDAFLKQLA
jgi:[acyl-carrier-protein] S-malonyltransferase